MNKLLFILFCIGIGISFAVIANEVGFFEIPEPEFLEICDKRTTVTTLIPQRIGDVTIMTPFTSHPCVESHLESNPLWSPVN